jgi:hypothetical protein
MPPRRSWHGLSLQEQRQVLRAARRREEHPNAEIADAAYRWAQEMMQPGQLLRSGLIGGLLSLVSDAAGGGWFGMAIAERRAAKRILRARAPERGSYHACGTREG